MILFKINDIRIIPENIFEKLLRKNGHRIELFWTHPFGEDSNIIKGFMFLTKSLKGKLFIPASESYKTYSQVSEISKLYPELPSLFNEGVK